jgi:hypothetical protein
MFLGDNQFLDRPQLSFDILISHFGLSLLYPRGILGTSHAKVPAVLSKHLHSCKAGYSQPIRGGKDETTIGFSPWCGITRSISCSCATR